MKSGMSYILEGLAQMKALEGATKEEEAEAEKEAQQEFLNKVPDGAKKALQSLTDRSRVNEDRWVTMRGTHVLVGDDGTIKNENLRKKIEGRKKKSGVTQARTARADKASKSLKSDKEYDDDFKSKSDALNKKYGKKDLEPGMENLIPKEGDDFMKTLIMLKGQDNVATSNDALRTRLGTVGKKIACMGEGEKLSDDDRTNLEGELRKALDIPKDGSPDDEDLTNLVKELGDSTAARATVLSLRLERVL